MLISWTSLATPVGPLILVEHQGRPLVVEFSQRGRSMKWIERLRLQHPGVTIDPGPCPATAGWLEAYFQRRPRTFPYPDYLADYFQPSPVEQAVWQALCRIPVGETRSYEAIAEVAGCPARVVGQASGANHLAILLPCHRVVGKDGALVGYGGGLPRKRWLLDHELRMTGLVLS